MRAINYKMRYKSLLAYDILRLSKKYPNNSKKDIELEFFSESNQKLAIELLKPFQTGLQYLKDKGLIADFKIIRSKFTPSDKKKPDYYKLGAIIDVLDIINRPGLKKIAEVIDWPNQFSKQKKGKIVSLQVIKNKKCIIVNGNTNDIYTPNQSVNANSFYEILFNIAEYGSISYQDSNEYKKKYKQVIDYFNSNPNCPLYSWTNLNYSRTKILIHDKKQKEITSNIKILISE